MGSFLARVAVNAVALWAANWLLPGMDITTTGSGVVQGDTVGGLLLAYLFLGLIFGVVNALVRPVVKLLALPLTILTLGLFTVVINALMLMLTAWLSSHTPVHLSIDSFFWTAVPGAVIISVISVVASRLIRSDRRR
ncbi:phage holin family protein [Paenarthrobacter sp. DKR-5]|uniref:phage holin family protein n=1 Tax=Paenarthrobacter sp. DKR-5 TaxID=2835535 RepID=UPI001BDD7A24|nr:phage holin family protein [Paenarthrobacter sp. DKR-5]MBT1004425.1 phage holin family protein [Paenarthrobacter sp. DKR-5]